MSRLYFSSMRFHLRLLALLSGVAVLGLALYLVISIPTAATMAASQRIWVRNLLVLGLVAIGVLGITELYGERVIVRRLRGLIETTKRWAAGDLSVRSHLARQDGEFGQLGLACNEMVESLERHLLEHKQAERRERQRAVELDKAYRELQATQAQVIQTEKLAAIGRLASGIVHEVKNPLGIALLGVGLLTRAQQPSPEKIAEASKTIKDAVTRADNVVHGLLTLARPASLQLTPGNLHDAIVASLVLVENQLTSKKVTVVKELMDDPPVVLLDSNQMQQVLMNLFVNAQQAMPTGGQLTIRTFTRKLTGLQEGVGRRASDRFQLGEDALVCEVQDTGVGIPKDQLDKVFEPFFTTKPAGEGTGLGLAVVRSIIDNHRGAITIDSVEGYGTTIRIMLPICSGKT